MILSAQFLQDVGGVNNYTIVTQASFTHGDSANIYFQIIDSSVFKAVDGFNPSGRRIMPASGAILSVTFGNLDNNKKVSRFCTQPFAQDTSIWLANVLATDPIEAGTVDFKITLNEGGNIKTGYICAGIRCF